MPTYEYRCSSCGSRVEIVHSIHGGPAETCPVCGAKDTLRKAFAPPAIVFKGTGWAKKERSTARAGGSRDASTSGDGTAAGGASGAKDSADGSDGARKPTTSPTSTSSSADSATPKSEPTR